MGHHRLPDHLDHAGAGGRQARRHVRPEAFHARRHGRIRRRLGALRPVAKHAGARGVPRPAGRLWRHPVRLDVRGHDRPVSAGAASPDERGVRRHLRSLFGHRTVARWISDRRAGLALGFLRQRPAGRGGHDPGRNAAPARALTGPASRHRLSRNDPAGRRSDASADLAFDVARPLLALRPGAGIAWPGGRPVGCFLHHRESGRAPDRALFECFA